MSKKSAKSGPQDAARELLQKSDLSRDGLPYTPEFERLFSEYQGLPFGRGTRNDFWKLLSSVAKKGGLKGKKPGDPPPALTPQQADLLRGILAGRLGDRDGLPYTAEFDKYLERFNAAAGLTLNEGQFWRAVCRLGKRSFRPDVEALLDQAADSLTLGVDRFNGSSDRGRRAAVLIFMHHACEMLFKAALTQRGVDIHDPKSGYSLSFEKCLNLAADDGRVKFLTDAERQTLRVLDTLRDQAQHYLADVSEHILYTVAQSTLTLFGDLLGRLFGVPLGERLPRRVLPLSTDPPRDIRVVMDEEFTQLKTLLTAGPDSDAVSEAKLRCLLGVERTLDEKDPHVPADDLSAARRAVRGASSWDAVFPGIARLTLTPDGTGSGLTLHLSKTEGVPVRVAADGEGIAGAVVIRRVDESGYYCFGVRQMADLLKVGEHILLALIHHLSLQTDKECFKVLTLGSVKAKRYSQKALDRLKEALPVTDLEQIWKAQQAKRARKKR